MLAVVINACIFSDVFLIIRISINNSDLSSSPNLHLIVKNHIFPVLKDCKSILFKSYPGYFCVGLDLFSMFLWAFNFFFF